jgi:hypothetical protein
MRFCEDIRCLSKLLSRSLENKGAECATDQAIVKILVFLLRFDCRRNPNFFVHDEVHLASLRLLINMQDRERESLVWWEFPLLKVIRC